MADKILTVFFTNTQEETLPKLNSLLEKYSGKLMKTIGNACLCTFDTSLNACTTAIKFRNSFFEKKECRIALTRGPVVVAENDILGEPVNLAAQLEGITKEGQIYIAESVYRDIEQTDIPCKSLGVRTFKAISEPVRIFCILEFAEHAEDIVPLTLFEQAKLEEVFDLERAQEIPSQPDNKFLLALNAQSTDIPISLDIKKDIPPPKSSYKQFPPQEMVDTSDTQSKSRISRWILGLTGLVIVGVLAVFILQTPPPETTPESGDSLTLYRELTSQKKDPSKALPGQPSFATLSVKTAPPQAEVFIDKIRVAALTPVLIRKVHAQVPLQVTIKKKGFEDTIQWLNLEPNEEKEMKLKLVQKQQVSSQMP